MPLAVRGASLLIKSGTLASGCDCCNQPRCTCGPGTTFSGFLPYVYLTINSVTVPTGGQGLVGTSLSCWQSYDIRGTYVVPRVSAECLYFTGFYYPWAPPCTSSPSSVKPPFWLTLTHKIGVTVGYPGNFGLFNPLNITFSTDPGTSSSCCWATVTYGGADLGSRLCRWSDAGNMPFTGVARGGFFSSTQQYEANFTISLP